MIKKFLVTYEPLLRDRLKRNKKLATSPAMTNALKWIAEFERYAVLLDKYTLPEWMKGDSLCTHERGFEFFDPTGWKSHVREDFLEAFLKAHRIECVVSYWPSGHLFLTETEAVSLRFNWYKRSQKEWFQSLGFFFWMDPAGSVGHQDDSFK